MPQLATSSASVIHRNLRQPKQLGNVNIPIVLCKPCMPTPLRPETPSGKLKGVSIPVITLIPIHTNGNVGVQPYLPRGSGMMMPLKPSIGLGKLESNHWILGRDRYPHCVPSFSFG